MSEKNRNARHVFTHYNMRSVPLCLLGVVWGIWIIIYILYSVALIQYPYDWEPGEGSKILYAQRLLENKPLYKSNNTFPMLGNCYPPMYPLIVAALVKYAGPQMWCGRIVSFVAILLMMAMIYRIASRHNCSRVWGIVAAGCFAMPAFIANWYSLARMDSLCSFFLLGMVYVVWEFPKFKYSSVVAGILAVCAVFTKQTAVFCIAGLGMYYLLSKQWRNLIAFCITGLVAGWLCFAVCNSLSDGWFYRNIMSENTHRLFFIERYPAFFGAFFFSYPWAWIIGIGVAAWKFYRRNVDIWFFYACGGLVNALLIGANGSGPNYFFTLWSALALFFAEGLALLYRWYSENTSTKPLYKYFVLYSLLAVLCTNWVNEGYGFFFQETLMDYIPTGRSKKNMEQLEALIRNEEGMVFVDRLPSLTLKYDKSGCYMEPALIQELYYAEKWDPNPFLKMIEDKKCALILLFSESLIPKPVKDAVKNNYLLSDRVEIDTFEIWRKRVVLIYRRPPDNFHR